MSALQEVADDVHLLVGNAYDINGVAANQVKHDVPALRKAVVALTDIRSMFAQLRIFSKPMKSCFDGPQITVSLKLFPMLARCSGEYFLDRLARGVTLTFLLGFFVIRTRRPGH